FEDLQMVELDRRNVRKLRSSASLYAEIFTPDTEFINDYPFRRRIEVEGGYKIARRRGARLDEVNVYNLFSRFRNSQVDHSEARAFTYRTLGTNEECIILLPDDTEGTIEEETHIFEYSARLIAEGGKLTP